LLASVEGALDAHAAVVAGDGLDGVSIRELDADLRGEQIELFDHHIATSRHRDIAKRLRRCRELSKVVTVVPDTSVCDIPGHPSTESAPATTRPPWARTSSASPPA